VADPRVSAPDPEDPFADAYGQLRRLAASLLRTPGHTLQPTALVHEAWLRLEAAGADSKDRARFLGMAAMTMRHVLVDHERRRRRTKRGGNASRTTLIDGHGAGLDRAFDLLEFEDALQALATLDERKARVAELRVFGGATIQETATALGVSHMTVSNDWQLARRWLVSRLL
jgi:RNA polymerase sigma factor (TIGR02999 family)